MELLIRAWLFGTLVAQTLRVVLASATPSRESPVTIGVTPRAGSSRVAAGTGNDVTETSRYDYG